MHWKSVKKKNNNRKTFSLFSFWSEKIHRLNIITHDSNQGSVRLPYSFIYQASWFLFSQML